MVETGRLTSCEVAVQTNKASKAMYEYGPDHTILMLMKALFSIFLNLSQSLMALE